MNLWGTRLQMELKQQKILEIMCNNLAHYQSSRKGNNLQTFQKWLEEQSIHLIVEKIITS